MSCPSCRPPRRRMASAAAAVLYERLRPYLRVVPSYGCYTPPRRPDRYVRGDREHRAGDHSVWPLHHWDGPGKFPLVVEWRPGSRPNPTFTQFCLVYNLDVVED